MNLVVKSYKVGSDLWCVFDEDRKLVKYSSMYKSECEQYVERNQHDLTIKDARKKRLFFEDVKDWDYSKLADICMIKEDKKIHGTLVYFKVLNKKELQYVLYFKNTEVLNIKTEYAPEIQYVGIAIYDKCIR